MSCYFWYSIQLLFILAKRKLTRYWRIIWRDQMKGRKEKSESDAQKSVVDQLKLKIICKLN